MFEARRVCLEKRLMCMHMGRMQVIQKIVVDICIARSKLHPIQLLGSGRKHKGKFLGLLCAGCSHRHSPHRSFRHGTQSTRQLLQKLHPTYVLLTEFFCFRRCAAPALHLATLRSYRGY